MRIIKSEVDKIKFSDKDVFYWDDDLKGFGIKTTATSKTYIIQGRVNNKSIRRKIGNVGTLTPDEARKEAIKTLAELAKGVNVNAEKKKDKLKGITVKEAYEDFLKIRGKTLKEHTLYDYNRAIETTFKDWQNMPLQNIKKDMVQKKFLKTSAKSESVAQLHFRFFRALFNFSILHYEIDDEPIFYYNPCDKLKEYKLLKKSNERDEIIEDFELSDFWHALAISEDDTLQLEQTKNQCKILLLTGCREQEIAGLKRKDIDLYNNFIKIGHTKNGKKHVFPMGRYLTELLKEICLNKKPDDFLFPAKNKSGHLKDHRKNVAKIAAECGVKLYFHKIRHTFATIAKKIKTDYYSIQRLLNHTNNNVTDIYINLTPDDIRESVQKIEDYILTQAGVKEPEKANNTDNVVDINEIRKNA